LSGLEWAMFEDFYRDEFKPLIWFAVRAGASAAEAEDVAQEAMKATWARWSEIDNPRAYARTAALRVLYRAHGRAKREQAAAPGRTATPRTNSKGLRRPGCEKHPGRQIDLRVRLYKLPLIGLPGACVRCPW